MGRVGVLYIKKQNSQCNEIKRYIESLYKIQT